MDLSFDWIGRYGYGAIFGLLLLGIVGLPVPDETLLLFVGYLVSKEELQLGPALLAAFLGSACGITVSYGLGRLVGTGPFAKLAPYVHVGPEQVARTCRSIERWGKYVLLFAYFVPGFRHVAALLLGASHLALPAFAPFAYTGALIWSGTFIGIGYVAGEEWEHLISLLHRTIGGGAILVMLTLSLILIAFGRKTA